MSVAKRYKKINLDGAQCFALLRAIARSEASIQKQLTQTLGAEIEEAAEHIAYLRQQLADVRAVRQVFNDTPFVEA